MPPHRVPAPPAEPAPGAIDVWLFALDPPAARLAVLETLLDGDERARADRCRYPRDRRRFVARRGQVRELLGDYTGTPPADLRFARNRQGKPALMEGGDLRFNLSHSDGLALCAVARGIEIGCDVERRDPALADPAVAERLFAPAEWRAWQGLPPEQRTEGFFHCWTRKEAFIKAIGLGLSHPLDAFEVSLAPGEPARLLRGAEGWSIASFDAAPGYQAALVAAGNAAGRMGSPRWFSGAPAAAAPA